MREAHHNVPSLRRDEFVTYLLATLQPCNPTSTRGFWRRLIRVAGPLPVNRDAVPELASIRRETDARFDDAIAGIPKTDRWGLYIAVVTLHRLKDLIQHDLETLAAHCKGTSAYYADYPRSVPGHG